jgi:hypothetical protein
MKWNVNGYAAIEGDRRQILVKERLKHDDFITLFKESSEDGILA